MRTTIDRAGRLVVPKALRDSLRLLPGQELDIVARQGHLEIRPAPVAMQLVSEGQGVVAVTERELPVLTSDLVRDTLEQVRR